MTRHQQLILIDDESILDLLLMGQDLESGQVLACDVTAIVSPVLTLPRTRTAKVPSRETEDSNLDLFFQELENLTLNDSKNKEKNVDSDWNETESETKEIESLSATSSSLYAVEDEDNLICSIKDNEDDSAAPKDLCSPERTKRLIEYWVPDQFSGTVKNVLLPGKKKYGMQFDQ
ncbi:MAG: hypothetical protein SGBAC_010151 [Bacillariaceae sp.]